jgi:hypothetical protein
MKIKTIFLIFFLFLFNANFLLRAVDYPNTSGPQYDRYVNVLSDGTDPFPLVAGDLVGWSGTYIQYGICHFPYGLQTFNGGTGYVDLATPLPVNRYLELSTACVLYLRSDLILGGRIDVTSSGRIKGGVDRIILNGPIYLNGNYIDAWEFSLRFSGNGNTIFFNGGGYMRVRHTGYDFEFRNIVLDGLDIRSARDANNPTGDYNLLLEDVVIKLDSDFCFNGPGEINIYNDVLVTGTHTFCLDGACYIYDNARLMFDVGTTFSMGLHGAITMADNHTGSIYFNGCNIIVADNDFNGDETMVGGRIIFENEVTIDDEGNYGEFVIGANTGVDVLGNARIVLENTTTFSIL